MQDAALCHRKMGRVHWFILKKLPKTSYVPYEHFNRNRSPLQFCPFRNLELHTLCIPAAVIAKFAAVSYNESLMTRKPIDYCWRSLNHSERAYDTAEAWRKYISTSSKLLFRLTYCRRLGSKLINRITLVSSSWNGTNKFRLWKLLSWICNTISRQPFYMP